MNRGLFFLFYFNRLFATMVSYAVRLYTWYAYRIYIDIEALQISLLGGRIFFKGIRYHGDNLTVVIHGGFITWRYWLRKVKETAAFDHRVEGDNSDGIPLQKQESPSSERTKQSNLNNSGKKHRSSPKQLPCRIAVEISGFEAFLYNNGLAYENIVNGIKKKGPNPTGDAQTSFAQDVEKTGFPEANPDDMSEGMTPPEGLSPGHSEKEARDVPSAQGKEARNMENMSTNASGYIASQTGAAFEKTTSGDRVTASEFPSFLRILPVHIKCNTGGVVLGNEHTKSVITVKFDSAEGEIDADRSGPLDIFKLLTSFDISHPLIHLRPNTDFKGAQLSEAAALKTPLPSGDLDTFNPQEASAGGLSQRLRHVVNRYGVGSLAGLTLRRRASQGSIAKRPGNSIAHNYLPANQSDLPGQGKWLGLSRYLKENQQDEHDEWNAVEYAKSSTLADISSLRLGFNMDMPGTVPSSAFATNAEYTPSLQDINGSVPPEYSLDLVVRGGQITYGPWADRHRIILQQIFFPTPYTDAMPTEPLKTGETRIATVFNLNLAIEGDTTLRIPFRESSKDWRWTGRAPASGTFQQNSTAQDKRHGKHKKRSFKIRSRAHAGQPSDIRPFGWFDITINPNSSVKYVMAMVAGHKGFRNNLTVDVTSMVVSSSLNHGLLLRSEKVELRGDLSNPLAWNGLRSWPFDIAITKLECFLLRDHTFMIVDLIADWGAGPPPEFFTFAPFRYLLGIRLHEIQLYLNTNDANIVNNPDDLDDNNFVILQSREISADLVIPLDRFRPSQSEITFDVIATDLALRLCMPPINTVNVLLAEKEIARLDSVVLRGVYSACSEVAPGLTETLNMDIVGDNLTLDLYGFVARQLIRIKENYFGDDIHFRTMEEYRESFAKGNTANIQPPAKANDLDVILNIKARNVNIILPAELYSADEHVKAHLEVADVDLRVTNYYLEMMVNASPLELDYTWKVENGSEYRTSSPQLVLDGAKVFGHRLFGLPPAEPPYVDDWEIDAGSLLGECSSDFLRIMMQASQAIAMTISDDENAMSVPPTVVWHQATFVQFKCPLVRLGCLVEQAAFLVSIEGVQGTFSDWAGQLFSQRLKMSVPKLSLICCDQNSALRSSLGGHSIVPYAQIETSLSMNMVQRNINFDDERIMQQEHIRAQDVRASRAQFLLRAFARSRGADKGLNTEVNAPSIPVPPFPEPLSEVTHEQGSRSMSKTVAFAGSSQSMVDSVSSNTSRSSRSAASIAGSVRRSAHAPKSSASETSLPEQTDSNPHVNWDSATRSGVQAKLNGAKGQSHRPSIPSVETLSSPYKLSSFPLSEINFSRAEMPSFPLSTSPPQAVPLVSPSLSALHDDTVHTSLIFTVEPGLIGFVQPEAIRALASVLRSFDPVTPGAILDSFHKAAIGEVLAKRSRKHGKSSVLEINARVPHIHLRFINSSSSGIQQDQTAVDKYSCIANDIGCMVRIAALPENKKGKDTISLHGTLASLLLSANEGAINSRDEGVALRLNISDVLVWLADGDRTSLQASFKTVEAATASSKVDYIASLIHRTAMLAEDFKGRFACIGPRREAVLHYLVYKLTIMGINMRDPSFLTRPSQALRSAKNHLRNSDSWKIISKYHYVYQNISREQQAALFMECNAEDLQCPPDAESQVFATLDEWRSWDALQIKDSFAMRILYGSSEGIEQLHDRSDIPISVTIRAAGLDLIVDPGEKQSQFSLDGLAICLSIIPAPPPAQLLLFDRYTETRDTLLQVNTSKLDLRLTWEICEIVDQVLTLFERSASAVGKDAVSSAPKDTSKALVERVHVVFASRFSSIQLKTINVTQIVSSELLQLSVSGVGWAPEDQESSVNALISADTGIAEMYGKGRLIWRSTVRNPAVWVNYDRRVGLSAMTESVKIAGDSKEIVFGVHDDIVGVLEVASAVLKDEVKYFQDLAEKHHIVQEHSATAPHQEQAIKAPTVTVALFLDVYQFNFKLLSGVAYSTTGRTVRLSVSPTEKSLMMIDFDLKSQVHKFIYGHSTDAKITSVFHLPATNGAVRLRTGSNLIDADATLIMERINLDGRAVYELLSILGDQSVSEGFEAIKAESTHLKEIVEEQFPQSPSKNKTVDQKTFLFDVNAVLAGFSITADMPSKDSVTKPATFSFDLSSTQIRVSNRSSYSGAALPFPEMRVAFNEIRADVWQLAKDSAVPCGRFTLGANFRCAVSQPSSSKRTHRDFALTLSGPFVDVHAETAPTIVELMVHLQNRISNLDLSKEKEYLRKLRRLEGKGSIKATSPKVSEDADGLSAETSQEGPFVSTFAFDMQSTQLSYIVGAPIDSASPRESEDLVFTVRRMHLMTRSEAVARLGVEDMQLQFVPRGSSKKVRSSNSALLPEVIINVTHASTRTGRKVVLQAAGKALDICLNPHFILPASDLERSISDCGEHLRSALAPLHRRSSSSTTPNTSITASKGLLGNTKVASLKLNADFAGAIVRLQGLNNVDTKKSSMAALHTDRPLEHGRYGQFDDDGATSTATLRAPGIAVKIQYLERQVEDASLNVEVCINGSDNILYPTVVPLILQISDSVTEVMHRPKKKVAEPVQPQVVAPTHEKTSDEGSLTRADPRAILGKTKLNFGFRIRKQELALSCQPIAKVAASAKMEDIYITVNTVESNENGNFFAASIAFRGLGASLQHVYSREPTFNIYIESIILSIMNSKHISGTPGISAMLKLNPTKMQINAKQLQELLLFREIWMPPEIRHAHKEFTTATATAEEPQEYFVQRYRQVAAQTGFPWNASVAVADLNIELDLGQTIGKTSFRISNFWVSSKKSSNAKQTLCIGIDDMGISSSGRMSGFVELQRFKVRTSIAWPKSTENAKQTPLVQGSIGFERLRVKAAFDYTAFAVVDIKAFEYIMYNVRDAQKTNSDRLVAILDGDSINIYCTAASAGLGVSLYQAFERLAQEKEANYERALQEIERFLRRKSIAPAVRQDVGTSVAKSSNEKGEESKTPLSLHTDVVVTLRSLDIGAFPSTLLDHQIFRAEASDIQARFAVTTDENSKLHSGLGLSLGQVSVSLAAVPHPAVPKTLGETTIEDVVNNAKSGRGGIILRVPRVVAMMQTWQRPNSRSIEYIFKSIFEGKIDVGWNYSRISFIRGMWATHTRTLASRLGKPLPESAVKISGGGVKASVAVDGDLPTAASEQEKITAVVNLPQSKYTYTALEPPVIDTPQLRDMGEATPPLEWVGLQREKLPNVTHQIVIVTLLEIAREVEDVYSRILGSA